MFTAGTTFGSQTSTPAFGQAQPSTGSGIFGQAMPSSSTTTIGFGSTPTPAPGTTSTFGQSSTSLFGQPQQQQQQTTSLFGQPQQPQQTSSLFGQASQPATSTFGQTQQPASTTSLFGQPQSSTQPTSSLFGQPQQPGQTSLFGQPQQQTTSLFGQPQPGQQTQQQTSSLFGQAQPAPSTSLFGQPQPSQQSTSLFGQPQQQQTSSLFGQPQQQQSSSLFGQPQQQSTSLFGQPQQQQSTSLFGQQPQSQPTTSGFGFGQTQQTTSLFGQKPSGQSTSTWPVSTPGSTGIFGAGQPPQPSIQPSLPAWEIEIQTIVNAYDPNHPQCRFQYALYNKVDDASGIEPAPAFRIHTGLYQQAIRENPDPKHLVPVPALGFEALKQRIAQQAKARAHHSTEIEICKERINQLEQDHDCIKKVSIPEYRQRHLDLSRRLLAVAKTLDIQQGRGFPRSDAELKLSKELEALERAADKLRVSVEGIASSVPVQDSQESQIDMLRLNPSDPNFKRIYEFLDQQRESLKSLIALLNQDSRDLNQMIKGYSQKLQQSDQPNP